MIDLPPIMMKSCTLPPCSWGDWAEWESPRLSPGRPCYKSTRWVYIPVEASGLHVRRGHNSASVFLPTGDMVSWSMSLCFVWLYALGWQGRNREVALGPRCQEGPTEQVHPANSPFSLISFSLMPCCPFGSFFGSFFCHINATVIWLDFFHKWYR